MSIHFKEEFTKIYNSLNQQQQLAVNTIEGPVIVNAGPGTGKTQILAARIGNILLQPDTNPNNILCLTYTDNGAVEMRNRLLTMIGTAAYNIQIHTYHSFCNEIIQDNIIYFGKLNLEPISELEEIDLFYKLIDSIESNSPLKRFRGDIYYEKNRLKSLFSLMKKEAWAPEYLNERIDTYIKELPTKEGFYYKKKYKEFSAGDPKQAAIASETEKMEMLRAAINLYPKYNEMMKAISRYNFDDMILWVLDAFEKNKNLLLDYQERYQYVLVDEFQDTSRSQNLLIQYLINYWEVPNVFVVGDADQSIFSFQDANVQNIEAFIKKYKTNIVQIDLVNNYRSTQNILEAAHQLINNNQQRITNNNTALISSKPELQNITIQPQIKEFINPAQEAVYVATKIENLIQQGVSGKEIAVIYRNHAQVEGIIKILQQKKIPFNTKRKTDLLQLPLVHQIISILSWIDKENYISYSADDLLFQILHYQFFNINSLEIAKLSIAVNEKKNKNKEDVFSLRRLIAETPNIKADLFNEPNAFIKKASNILETLLQEQHNITLQHLIEKTIQQTGLLFYIMKDAEKPWLIEVLTTFFNFIKEETKRQPDLTLHEFLNNIEVMKKNKISIPLYKTTASDVGVNLVTAHSSKGSEFEHVFIIGCTQSIWDDKNSASNKVYSLPDNLISNHNISTNLEESRRLFYVAITRAKINLYISYAATDNKDKPQLKSSFITELITLPTLNIEQAIVSDNDMTDYLALQFMETAIPEINLIDEAYINKLLQSYTLSVTHLNNYLSCPLKFYYQNLIKVPSAKNESMVFGSAVHYALEMLFKKMKTNNDVFPDETIFVDDFKWYLHTNREAFTPETFKLKLDYGEKILPAYYQYHINTWNKIIKPETPIRNVVVQNVPLNGKLDKLEFNGNEVNVVDYKTGNFQNAKKKLLPPNDNDPLGGDYWRQAVFYKILIDNDKRNNWQVVSTQFEFVEPVNNEYKTEKVIITPADVTTVTQQITTTWQKVQNKEFKKGCGKSDCDWCNFVKNNNLTVALHKLNEEEA
ncbi:MAG: ATP-dependent helicase [Bacteroidetes bacterium]|nr:ATP-dependent helicase [Bacteroidota bacterium]MBS1649453.1 ATP-dependent helicase [Bacteroidota bacterium]